MGTPLPNKTIDYAEWQKHGENTFGKDIFRWRFICPVCGHEAVVQDWIDAGAAKETIGISCIGRYRKDSRSAFTSLPGTPGPCTYAGYGLFRLNPIHVRMPDGKYIQAFDFADSPLRPPS